MQLSRFLPAFAAAVLLAACQTTADPSGLSHRQVATLRANGFVQTERGWEFDVGSRVLFATDESSLVPDQRERLKTMAHTLHAVEIDAARVEGHTDVTGSDGYNEALSLRRARAVADALIEGGMAQNGVVPTGLGARDPVESNATAQGRHENRRVVIIVGGQS
ncbi:OmpA family protein [Sphingobium aquiterrae]|uniref:OmpA family protein n=1 Tax=Sphingobium aquiterrae TaxID=2038656 RepID=UPI003017287D